MIILYVLEFCPSCLNSLKVLKENKIKHQAIIVENTPEEKNFYKKQNKMDTFPQIFLQIDNDKYMKIGGNYELVNIINYCKTISDSHLSIDSIYHMYSNMFGNK
jgi:glutaredoxin